MDEKLLIQCGLSQNQARTYRLLVLRKSLKPTELAKITGETRSNCYALLDKLVELDLATKLDENKKFTYYPASPLALKNLLDQKRKEAEEQLLRLDAKMPQMMTAYQQGGEAPKVKHYKGKKELEQMYYEQMEEEDRNLYFIRSTADIQYFGFAKMDILRKLAPHYKKRRFGITPMISKGRNKSPHRDGSTNLRRAKIERHEYTAPVEWAVSGNKVQAILLKNEGYGITIENTEIAESFKQMLNLLHQYIRLNPDNKEKFEEQD